MQRWPVVLIAVVLLQVGRAPTTTTEPVEPPPSRTRAPTTIGPPTTTSPTTSTAPLALPLPPSSEGDWLPIPDEGGMTTHATVPVPLPVCVPVVQEPIKVAPTPTTVAPRPHQSTRSAWLLIWLLVAVGLVFAFLGSQLTRQP